MGRPLTFAIWSRKSLPGAALTQQLIQRVLEI
jgi:hypothetical protein